MPERLRGTYAGLPEPAVIDHLTRLGVTAVELLPVHQFVHDGALVARGLRNYRGYQSIDFCAPHNEYSSSGDRGGQVDEFKAMAKSLHAAGLEMILDVVFNHTAEGNERGATLCFHGLDNGAYYLLAETAAATWRLRGSATRSTRTSLLVMNETRERATPNAGFCSLGTMRKPVTRKTSFHLAAIMATLRAAHLSCAERAPSPGDLARVRGASRLARASATVRRPRIPCARESAGLSSERGQIPRRWMVRTGRPNVTQPGRRPSALTT